MNVEKSCENCYNLKHNLEKQVKQDALPDSGKRVSFGEGRAVREDQRGRGRYDLISPVGLRRLALHYEKGAEKYSDRNWEKGVPTHQCFNSISRHMLAYLDGDKSEDHLGAIAWNAFAMMHMEERMPEMQTIPTRLEIPCTSEKED